MTRRPPLKRATLLSVILSAVLGVGLIGYLLACAGFDMASTARLTLTLQPRPVVEVTLLLGVNALLGAEKWLLIDRCLAGNSRNGMSRFLYFGFTAIGLGLGQIVPVQLSLALSRTLGAHLHGGRGFMRGTAATLFDQFFDLAIALVTGLASLLTIGVGGGGALWWVSAFLLGLAGCLFCGRGERLIAGLAMRLGSRGTGRLSSFCARAGGSRLLTVGIGRRLYLISALRFGVLTLIGVVTAGAASADVAVWQVAGALPFAMIGNVVAITPGGLGVNEWAASSALVALGGALHVAAEWTIVNRLLVAVAAMVCGMVGLLIVGAESSWRKRTA